MSLTRKNARKRSNPQDSTAGEVLFTRDFPKPRSAKIMRRMIRATYLGKEPGDAPDTALTLSMVRHRLRHVRSASSLENPAAVKAVAEAT